MKGMYVYMCVYKKRKMEDVGLKLTPHSHFSLIHFKTV